LISLLDRFGENGLSRAETDAEYSRVPESARVERAREEKNPLERAIGSLASSADEGETVFSIPRALSLLETEMSETG